MNVNFSELKYNLEKLLKEKKKSIGVLLLVILVIVGISFLLTSKNKGDSSLVKSSEVTSAKAVRAKATVKVDKSFNFEGISAKKEAKPLKFTITQVERKDQISVKGEPKKLSDGRDFLLVRIELQNDTTERLAIATIDRVRLEGEGGKLFAPDYHNGNVVVDPLSVRRDLLAFIVEASDKKFAFQTGELEGEKERIEVNF